MKNNIKLNNCSHCRLVLLSIIMYLLTSMFICCGNNLLFAKVLSNKSVGLAIDGKMFSKESFNNLKRLPKNLVIMTKNLFSTLLQLEQQVIYEN